MKYISFLSILLLSVTILTSLAAAQSNSYAGVFRPFMKSSFCQQKQCYVIYSGKELGFDYLLAGLKTQPNVQLEIHADAKRGLVASAEYSVPIVDHWDDLYGQAADFVAAVFPSSSIGEKQIDKLYESIVDPKKPTEEVPDEYPWKKGSLVTRIYHEPILRTAFSHKVHFLVYDPQRSFKIYNDISE